MALRRHPDGKFDLKLYFRPNSRTFLFSALLDDYDYDAYITASSGERTVIRIFIEKNGNARAKESYAEIIKSHTEREAAEQVEQLASTVEKLSLGSEAKYTDEDAERFLALSGKPGAISSLSNDDQQKYVYWKIDYLQPFIAQQTEERQRLETERVELDRRRDFLLRQTAEKILDELAEKNQTTSSVVNSGPTKKSSVTY